MSNVYAKNYLSMSWIVEATWTNDIEATWTNDSEELTSYLEKQFINKNINLNELQP